MGSRTPSPHIHKFGGASLANAAAVRHALDLIRGFATEPSVVVVSAMGRTTDRLLTLARGAAQGRALENGTLEELRDLHADCARAVLPVSRQTEVLAQLDRSLHELQSLLEGLRIVRELTPRLSDYVVARGERLSALLVASGLEANGVSARLADPVELIATDGRFGHGSPDFAHTEQQVRAALWPLLRKGVLVVVPGFVGGSPKGEVVTLGRGGSDLTATLLARALRARGVTLWKDVPGFLTADPNVVPDVRVIPQLHVREAAELAYYGAKVLHPRALTPLRGRRIAVCVRPFADPDAPGTEVAERRPHSRTPVRAISAIGGQALVTVTGSSLLGLPDVAARTFAALHEHHIPVAFITQASSEHSITFAVGDEHADASVHALRRAFREQIARHEIDDVSIQRGMAAVAVVGLGMAGARGVAARVFSAVAQAGVNIVAIAQGSSELNISFVVAEGAAAIAQRAIHSAFQMGREGGGVVLPERRVDVALLGFGQVGRALIPMLASAQRRGVPFRVVAVIDRTAAVIAPEGISPPKLARLRTRKARGLALSSALTGRALTPEAAVLELTRHAYESPVLVDLTASDTMALLRTAAEAGMHLILANKRPLTERRADAEALRHIVTARGRQLRFEATVGAGLPVMDTCKKLHDAADRIRRIDGCLSGTLGFVLDAVSSGTSFSAAVRTAMERGYTEPDPRDDLSGTDVARKALILGRLIGFKGELSQVKVESLVPEHARSLSRERFLQTLGEHDAEWKKRSETAQAQGHVLRYVAEVTPHSLRVGLRAVPSAGPFGSLHGTDNLISITTDRYRDNPLIIAGPGAGLEVTAAGVLNDLIALTPA